jgi:hypothetical protein
MLKKMKKYSQIYLKKIDIDDYLNLHNIKMYICMNMYINNYVNIFVFDVKIDVTCRQE